MGNRSKPTGAGARHDRRRSDGCGNDRTPHALREAPAPPTFASGDANQRASRAPPALHPAARPFSPPRLTAIPAAPRARPSLRARPSPARRVRRAARRRSLVAQLQRPRICRLWTGAQRAARRQGQSPPAPIAARQQRITRSEQRRAGALACQPADATANCDCIDSAGVAACAHRQPAKCCSVEGRIWRRRHHRTMRERRVRYEREPPPVSRSDLGLQNPIAFFLRSASSTLRGAFAHSIA